MSRDLDPLQKIPQFGEQNNKNLISRQFTVFFPLN